MIERMREHLPSALTVALALHRSDVCFRNRVIDLGSQQIDCGIHYHPCSLFVGGSGVWEVEFEGDQGEHCTVVLGSSAGDIINKLESLAEAEGWS